MPRKLLSVTLILVVVVAISCESRANTTEIYFKNPAGKLSPKISVEVVNTPQGRQVGLMYRRELAENSGMLFIFPETKQQVMWMKNTYIPLCLVFIDKNMSIVGFIEDVPILNEKHRFVEPESSMVLELNAGACRRLGVEQNSTLMLDGNLPAPL
jgi:uncharacterized membrane protein (UPF0127 family)